MTITARPSSHIRTSLAAIAAGAMIALSPTNAAAAPTATPAPSTATSPAPKTSATAAAATSSTTKPTTSSPAPTTSATTPAPSATTSPGQVPSKMRELIASYENMVSHNPNVVLGTKVGDIQCNADLTECWQVYEHGAIFADGTRAIRVTEPAYKALLAAGGVDVVGYPTSDQFCPQPGNGSCRQFYTNAEIDTVPDGTAAFVVTGAIREAFLRPTRSGQVGPAGPWGYPTSNQTCDSDGVCTQVFQYAVFISSPTTGAHYIPTAAYAVYTAGVTGPNPMGLPTSDPFGCYAGYCGQSFQHGQLFGNPDGSIVKLYGPIYDAYKATTGSPLDQFGVPTADQVCDLPGGACYQDFTKGRFYYSPATGAHWMPTAWVQGYTAGVTGENPLGLPTSDYTCAADGSCSQQFEHGTMTSQPGAAPVVKLDAIYARYLALGGNSGSLGAPVGKESCTLPNGGCYQVFEHGWIVSSPSTGAWEVTGEIQKKFASPEDMASQVGLPTGPAAVVNGVTQQPFEKSTVRIAPAPGPQPGGTNQPGRGDHGKGHHAQHHDKHHGQRHQPKDRCAAHAR